MRRVWDVSVCPGTHCSVSSRIAMCSQIRLRLDNARVERDESQRSGWATSIWPLEDAIKTADTFIHIPFAFFECSSEI